MTLTERLAELVRACFTRIWIESHEHQDALSEIARLCRAEHWRLVTWISSKALLQPTRLSRRPGKILWPRFVRCRRSPVKTARPCWCCRISIASCNRPRSCKR